MVKGWPMSTARTALSRIALKRAPLPLVITLRTDIQRAVAFEPDPNSDLELIGVLRADRRIPQRHQPRAQRVDFRLRQPGGVAARGAERRRRIELRSGRGVALRIALVEQ